MDTKLLERLSVISPEEQRILAGETEIDRGLYMQGAPDIINSKKLLEKGKLITLRPHTRFIDFPRHTHDYVEMIYMCSGSTTHVVGGKEIHLQAGELLLLNQSATHEVKRAGKRDVAVNFIVLPEFFSGILSELEDTPLRRFLVDCLFSKHQGPGYLHFQVSNVKTVQNLAENMLYTLLDGGPSKRRASVLTMSLLFLELTAHTEALCAPEQELALWILRYVESSYATGTLAEAAELLGCAVPWLSREIKKSTGSTFTEILQKKRLAQAAFLLRNTKHTVADVSFAVGYENVSYFHRLFFAEYGTNPKAYRDSGEMQ